MSTFYENAGRMALGSRLRRLSENLTEQAAKVYQLYGVDLDPKWFPVFSTLSQAEGLSISEIAQIIGHTHSSVSQIVKEMRKAKICESKKLPNDGRVTLVSLTKAGKALTPKFNRQIESVNAVAEDMLSESNINLWKALSELEVIIGEDNFFERVKSDRKLQESQKIQLIPFTDKHEKDFKRLNCEWIEKFFKLEESDRKALDHPRKNILDKGGYILMASYDSTIVGTCALIHAGKGRYELAKMAVSELAQGKNIGYLMGQSILETAKEMGADSVFLESNTALKPALNLYQKLGFNRVKSGPSPYERCNITMEVQLN